jgi:putative transposase
VGVFWKALAELWPTTREQHCWVHKTANVLNKLPKNQQPKAKRSLTRDLDGRDQQGC